MFGSEHWLWRAFAFVADAVCILERSDVDVSIAAFMVHVAVVPPDPFCLFGVK